MISDIRYSLCLPSILHFRIGPLWMQLSHILFHDSRIIGLRRFPTMLIVIDALFAIALDHALTQEFDRLVGNLAFTSTLFDCL